MKEITEYKELTPEEAKELKWPVKNCVFTDVYEVGWFKHWFEKHFARSLFGLVFTADNLYDFIDDFGTRWKHCAHVIHRLPIAVPEGVDPLPKPFLAYLGIGLRLPRDGMNGHYWITGKSGTWSRGAIGKYSDRHYAIDVSTEWAMEKFPKFVEAMEYEEVYGGWANRQFVGHRLGNRFYDLDWEEIKEEPNTEGNPVGKKSSSTGLSGFRKLIKHTFAKSSLDEITDLVCDLNNQIRDLQKETIWKYGTLDDYLDAIGFSPISDEFMSLGYEEAKKQWDAARELEGQK